MPEKNGKYARGAKYQYTLDGPDSILFFHTGTHCFSGHVHFDEF